MTNLDKLEDLLRKGEKEKAYELVKEDKGITAEILIHEGISFGIIGEYSISISYLVLAEKIAEDESIKEVAREELAVAYYNRGNAYVKLKESERAMEDYSKAIELNPNLAEAYNNRGNGYYELKESERAIEDYSRAIELNPNLAKVYYNRGVAYGEQKEYERAIEDYNKAIELNPKYADAYNNRGVAYGEQKEYERAIKDFSKAIELNPKYAVAYENRGITQLQTNEELEKAIEDFKHARDLSEGRDKERMLGFIEWAKARGEMTMKNWVGFRERMNEARDIFERIGDPLSHSIDAFIKFSYLDEKLDNALSIPKPIEALTKIEEALRNLPEVEGLIDPERAIFGARA